VSLNGDLAFDVLVVGAGPAGLAAAWEASGRGAGAARVGLVDENPGPGGQVWRGGPVEPGAKPEGARGRWVERVRGAGVGLVAGARVVALPAPGALRAETAGGCLTLRYGRLVLAPGARERLLPFPGWTLPNVVGAGGLQALIKSGLPVAGRSVVVAGSGPLLLAVAALVRSKGGIVRAVAEQAPGARVARFGLRLLADPAKLWQAAGYGFALRGVPLRQGWWPVAAAGTDRVESVTLTDGRRRWEIACDDLACGFGLVPNLDLPRALGCGTEGGAVVVDGMQRTTAAGVFCAGEATGVGGLDKSLVEGRIAGLAAAGATDRARRLGPRRSRAAAFGRALDRAFALRDELRSLPGPETVVCRCEDVRYAQLLPHGSARAAKLQTRCGMGPCQARVCGPALEFLFGWPPESARPPVFPARLGSLLASATDPT